MPDVAAADLSKNVFRLRGQLSRLTGQVRDITGQPIAAEAAAPEPADEEENGSLPSDVGPSTGDTEPSSDMALAKLSGDAEEEEQPDVQALLTEEVLTLKREKMNMLSCIHDFEAQQEVMMKTIEELQRGPVLSSQSPTRSEVIRENAVLSTRMRNFQDQLGETRADMEEELQLVHGDQSLMQEELACAMEDRATVQQQLGQLRAALAQEVEDKETKLAQAKECVNDVKDVVEILAKQLHDNQTELEQERSLRAKTEASLEDKCAQTKEELLQAKGSLTEAQQVINTLTQTNNELAQELQESASQSERVAVQLEHELEHQHESKRLSAEVLELRKEIQTLAIANANAAAREQELKEEITAFQKREEELGEELQHLTGAVDERIDAYQARELEMQLQLEQMAEERDQVLENAQGQSHRSQILSVPAKPLDEVDRLKQMASLIETQRHETLKALELSPRASPEFRRTAALSTQGHQEIEVENFVMKEALTKLRRADKEEAVVQAEAIRGVLKKELGALESELKKALEDRSQMMVKSSPLRVQELEANVAQLQQDLEMSATAVSSLETALRHEQVEKELVLDQLKVLLGDRDATDLRLPSRGELMDTENVTASVKSFFGNLRSEMLLQDEGDQELQNLLRTIYTSLPFRPIESIKG